MLGLLLYGSVAAAQETPKHEQPDRTTAFVNVNVIPMDRERILERQTVIIRGDRIHEIGPASRVKAPEAAIVIDGSDKYLLPGLADMHAHILVEDELVLFIANGVTTVRNMWGDSEILEWRDRINRGDLMGPTIYTAGPIIDGDPPIWPGSATITTPEQARKVVTEQKTAGFDFLKVYGNLSIGGYDALVLQANKENIPVAGHVPSAVGLDRVLSARQKCIEHLDGYATWLTLNSRQRSDFSYVFDWLQLDAGKISAIVRKTREANTWNCPTLVVYEKWVPPHDAEAMLEREEYRYVEPTMLDYHIPGNNYLKDFTSEMYEAVAAGNTARKQFTKALHDGGARILLGTDCANPYVIHGFSLHEELQNFVGAGLTPYQAIKAGTHDAAEYFDALEEFGTVAVGRRADLILVQDNPLEDVTKVAERVGVMVRGQWYPQTELQARLDALAEKYANQNKNKDQE
jgi:imidazolonepropionase-like amidohydrolase